MRATASILIALYFFPGRVQAADCDQLIDAALAELRRDGGIEYTPLIQLHTECRSELETGEIPRSATDLIDEINEYLLTWDTMQEMRREPLPSMKEELIVNRPDIAQRLIADLERLKQE